MILFLSLFNINITPGFHFILQVKFIFIVYISIRSLGVVHPCYYSDLAQLRRINQILLRVTNLAFLLFFCQGIRTLLGLTSPSRRIRFNTRTRTRTQWLRLYNIYLLQLIQQIFLIDVTMDETLTFADSTIGSDS